VAIATTTWFATARAQTGAVSLDHTSGLNVYDSTQFPHGRRIEFFIRITNNTLLTQLAVVNGFRLYSADGAEWVPDFVVDTHINQINQTTFDTSYYGTFIDPPADYIWKGFEAGKQQMFDGGIFLFTYVSDGIGADTIGLSGWVQLTGTGLPPGLDFVGWKIAIDSVDVLQVGRTLCLDSSFYPPSGLWSWAPESGPLLYPSWDGPHCFEIVDCCLGMRGNINHDNADEIDISDLNMMVNFMFRGGATPPCLAEANIDGIGDANPDIADLNGLVAYMFRNGAAPAACK
jgi:hypothetical protein